MPGLDRALAPWPAPAGGLSAALLVAAALALLGFTVAFLMMRRKA